ncbi:hypothetical protein [Novosphingobium sp.]|uniref:hypothetical protein n=1 Tax=Novosphingobium sp. TaxID=1874826 RepID=UPI0035AE5C58
MSSYTIESILFSLQSDPDFMARFKADPEASIRDYPLRDDERQAILDWDVRAMSDAGVSAMLLMVAFTALNGQQAMPDYMRRMNMPPLRQIASVTA